MSTNFKINFAFGVAVLVLLLILASIALVMFGGRHGSPATAPTDTNPLQPNPPKQSAQTA